MKDHRITLLFFASLVLGVVMCASPGQSKTPQLVWDNDPANGTNTSTVLYWRTNIPSGSDTNWMVLAVEPPGVSNHIMTNFTAQRAFFVATSSNCWGESDFSNMADTPAKGGTNKNLRVQ